jgi:predicted alpha/beta hydrolase family esterase
MAKNAIIVHGKPGKKEFYIARSLGIKLSKFHWLGWLAKQLSRNGYEVWAPEMPRAYQPDWDKWVTQKAPIGPDTTLVGHSCGGGFWIKYLSLNKKLKVGKVILVAPWIDPDGDETQGFFDDYQMDPNLVKRTKGLVVFNSDNDMGNVHKSVAQIRKNIKDVEYREFRKYGHFTHSQMKSREFPELLQACIND